MPLQNPHPARWSWKTAIAWIGFNQLDNMEFELILDMGHLGISRNDQILKSRAAAAELAERVSDGRLMPFFRATDDAFPLMDQNFLNGSCAGSRRLAAVLCSLLETDSAAHPIEHAIFDGLEFKRSDILGLWPQTSTSQTQSPPPPDKPGGENFSPRPSGSGARGSGRVIGFAGTFSEPDWEIYQHARELPLVQAIALSCNIWNEKHQDPDHYNLGQNWRCEQEYIKRLNIAKLRLGDIIDSRPSIVQTSPDFKLINLVKFRQFGEALGWTFPDLFPRTQDTVAPVPEPVALPTPDADEKDFILWAAAEKKKHGQWPPTDTEKTGARMGWRQWATTNGVDRETVSGWVKVYGLSNPVGAPKKSVK